MARGQSERLCSSPERGRVTPSHKTPGWMVGTHDIGHEPMALETSIRAALEKLPLEPQDAGTAELALTYAQAIDNGSAELEKAGPQLLAVLESLLMSPRARAAILKGGRNEPVARSPLDELRARRAARTSGTTSVDTAAS